MSNNVKKIERLNSLDSSGSPTKENISTLNEQSIKTSPSFSPSYHSIYNNRQNYDSYNLEIFLKEGRNLAVRDSNGLSDPYVKVFFNGSNVYKSKIISKNLNPQWNEKVTINFSKNNHRSKKSSSPTSSISSVTTNDDLRSISSNSTYPSTDCSETSCLNTFHQQCDENCSYSNLDLIDLSKNKLKLVVYDYDRLRDDLIGSAKIDLTQLKENVKMSLELELTDKHIKNGEHLGFIYIDLMLVKKPFQSIREDKKNTPSISMNSISQPQQQNNFINNQVIKPKPSNSISNLFKMKKHRKCVLHVILVEANNLISKDKNGLSDPYVKFKLENEEYRSKTIKKDLNPKYNEEFQFYLYENDSMNFYIRVYDQDPIGNDDDFMGIAVIDLTRYEFDKTHLLKLPIENGTGTISISISLTGIKKNNNLEDNFQSSYIKQKFQFDKKNLINTLNQMDRVGYLQVKVNRAESLASADINGKSDPFCCIKLVNQYVQTHTEYKTLNPQWGRTFEFDVHDIHSVLEITVLDENRNRVNDFLGKVEIPIINIQSGKKKCYALKDHKLMNKSKGFIELEMNLIYNPVTSLLKTFLKPKEEKYIEQEAKFKLNTLYQNIKRLHDLAQGAIRIGNILNRCLNWDDPALSLASFIVFVIFIFNFEQYMIPFSLVLLIFANYLMIKLNPTNNNEDDDKEINEDYFEEDEKEEEESILDLTKDVKKRSLIKQKKELEEFYLNLQIFFDQIASFFERIINIITFKTPWLSWFTLAILMFVTFLFYLVPLRFILLFYGTKKFAKRFLITSKCLNEKYHLKFFKFELCIKKSLLYDLIDPEIFNFLSRVPSNKELINYKEIKIRSN